MRNYIQILKCTVCIRFKKHGLYSVRTGRAKVPHEDTFLLLNISRQIYFKNTQCMVSLIRSWSNVFDVIKFEHPIPEIWSIY